MSISARLSVLIIPLSLSPLFAQPNDSFDLVLLEQAAVEPADREPGPVIQNGPEAPAQTEYSNEYSRGNQWVGKKDARGSEDYETAQLKVSIVMKNTGEAELRYSGKLVTAEAAATESVQLMALWETANDLRRPAAAAVPLTVKVARNGRRIAAGTTFEGTISLGTIPKGNGGPFKGTVLLGVPPRTGIQTIDWSITAKDGALVDGTTIKFDEAAVAAPGAPRSRGGKDLIHLVKSSYLPAKDLDKSFPAKSE